jgi:hypothetical protein
MQTVQDGWKHGNGGRTARLDEPLPRQRGRAAGVYGRYRNRALETMRKIREHTAALLQRAFERIFLRRAIERFYLVFGGHIFFQTLNAAVKLDLFTLLNKKPGLTRREIASQLGLKEQPTRILLLGLSACGFLRKRGACYFNSRLSNELLVRDSPRSLLSYVRLEDELMYRGMVHFDTALKTYSNAGLAEFAGDEPTIYQRLAHTPPLQKVFQDAMAELSVQSNKLLPNAIDLSDVRYLVDVGGGDGTNIIVLGRRYPQLLASVYDLPSVCEIASQKLQAAGLADRLNALSGDCFTDPLPEGVDCILFAHFMTMWSEQRDRLLLRKAYQALNNGGKVMIFNMMQNDDETGPLSAAVGSPYFLTIATGEGMLYTWREYEQWMKDAGFTKVKRVVLPRDHGVIIGTKS